MASKRAWHPLAARGRTNANPSAVKNPNDTSSEEVSEAPTNALRAIAYRESSVWKLRSQSKGSPPYISGKRTCILSLTWKGTESKNVFERDRYIKSRWSSGSISSTKAGHARQWIQKGSAASLCSIKRVVPHGHADSGSSLSISGQRM